MSKTIVRPTLSLGNHIYLYRLLRDAIGCGKQTFMTQVEEALAVGDMTAYDLGFESTRELLEELDDCIKLTVFKGGRLYATVIANEAWDAALAKGEDKPKTAKGAKQSYKKKKRSEKDLKAVRPKHVKRPEPEAAVEAVPEPEPETEIEVAIEVTAEARTEIAATTDPEVMSEQEATAGLNEAPKSTTEEAANQPETPAFQNSDVFGNEAEDDQPDEPANQDATEPTPEPETLRPAISLTVVYDPENANAGITTMASTPVETKPSVEAEDAPQANTKTETEDTSVPVEPTDSAAKPEAAPELEPAIESASTPVYDQIPAPVPAPVPAPAASTIPEDFPVDFATEVFCPGPLLHQLSTYPPYGADTLGIVGEYYWIARERGTIEAARNRASFPLRYTQAGERHEVTVRIRRNTTGGLGATWTIDKVEAPVE